MKIHWFYQNQQKESVHHSTIIIKNKSNIIITRITLRYARSETSNLQLLVFNYKGDSFSQEQNVSGHSEHFETERLWQKNRAAFH